MKYICSTALCAALCMHLTLIQIIWVVADLQYSDGVDYHHEKWKNTALAIVQQLWAWLHLVRDFTICPFFLQTENYIIFKTNTTVS